MSPYCLHRRCHNNFQTAALFFVRYLHLLHCLITWFLHVRAPLWHHNPSSHFGLLFTLPLCFTLSLGSPSLTCCFLTLIFFSDSRDAPLCSRCSFRILLCVLFVRLHALFFLFFFLLVFSWSPDALDMVLSHISRCVLHTYFWISQVMAQTFFSPFFVVYCSAAPHFPFFFRCCCFTVAAFFCFLVSLYIQVSFITVVTSWHQSWFLFFFLPIILFKSHMAWWKRYCRVLTTSPVVAEFNVPYMSLSVCVLEKKNKEKWRRSKEKKIVS